MELEIFDGKELYRPDEDTDIEIDYEKGKVYINICHGMTGPCYTELTIKDLQFLINTYKKRIKK